MCSKVNLFFREDWKEIPPEIPVTQEHVSNENLILSLHGPGKEGIKKSHHDNIENDPYYIWSGRCSGNWAVSLKHQHCYVDLTGLAKIRWSTNISGFRQLHLILRTLDGDWLIGDSATKESVSWQEQEFFIQDLRWRALNIDTVIEMECVESPSLDRVDEIGFTDLMVGGYIEASSRLNWIEVWGQAKFR